MLQPPLRPEERLEVIQRGIGCPYHEGIAARQALLEEAIYLGIPAPLQLAQGFYVEHLCRLIGHFPDLVIDRLWQAGGHSLQGANRVMPCHREALMHCLKCSFATVRTVLHRSGIVMNGANCAEGFIVVAGLFTRCPQHRAQPCKGTLNGPRLL
ncbi:hypothetical protein D3C76_1302580 [compost metagenome]